VADIERLLTIVDLEERDQTGHSAWAHLYVVLSTGERRILANDRGWSSSAEIAREGLLQVEHTARMVVGPDGPGPGGTNEQMETGYWEWMEHKLHDAGISAEADKLKTLPHEVEVGERLRHRLAMSA
jgi:hypothetical protein